MSYAYMKVEDVVPTISMNLFNAFHLDFYMHASYSAIMDLLVLKNSVLVSKLWGLTYLTLVPRKAGAFTNPLYFTFRK